MLITALDCRLAYSLNPLRLVVRPERTMTQQQRAPAQLQLGHESFSYLRSSSNMPIALANKRTLQSAKEQRDRHFSAHHVRQMVKLSTTATPQIQSPTHNNPGHAQHKESAASAGPKSTISSRSSAINTFDAKKQLENAFKVRSSAAMAQSPAPRPQSSGAFKPRKIEPTRFRYFCESVYAPRFGPLGLG